MMREREVKKVKVRRRVFRLSSNCVHHQCVIAQFNYILTPAQALARATAAAEATQ